MATLASETDNKCIAWPLASLASSLAPCDVARQIFAPAELRLCERTTVRKWRISHKRHVEHMVLAAEVRVAVAATELVGHGDDDRLRH